MAINFKAIRAREEQEKAEQEKAKLNEPSFTEARKAFVDEERSLYEQQAKNREAINRVMATTPSAVDIISNTLPDQGALLRSRTPEPLIPPFVSKPVPKVESTPEMVRRIVEPISKIDVSLSPREQKFKDESPLLYKALTKAVDVGEKVLESPFVRIPAAFGAGLEEGATLGLLPKFREKFQPEIQKGMEQSKEESPLAAGIGKFAGYFAPGIGFSKLAGKIASPILKGIASPTARMAVQEGLAGAGMGATEAAIEGSSLSDIAQRAKEYGVLGAGGAAIFGGIGAGLKKAGQTLGRSIDDITESPLRGVGDIESPTMAAKENIAVPKPSVKTPPQEVPTPKVKTQKKVVTKPVMEEAETAFRQTETTTEVPPRFKGEPTTGKATEISYEQIPTTNRQKAFEFERPEVETGYQAGKGIKPQTFYSKVKEGIDETLNKFTRPISTLKVDKENAQLYRELTRLSKIKAITGDDTIRTLDDITKGLKDKKTFDLFSRKVLLDDLAQEAKLGNKLPNQFTPEDVTRELSRLDEVMDDTVKEAITKRKQYWNDIKNDYIKAMDDIGVNVKDKFTKEDYFRHQVLEYMNNKGVYGTGKKLKTPTGRGFSKAREGTSKTINTDYIQAEYEVMAQMKHDADVARTIKRIKDNYDISKSVRAKAKAEGLKNWRDAIPEGYTTWQPREGNTFYFGKNLSETVADDTIKATMKELGLSDDIINKTFSNVGKRTEYVVREEIAETLNNLYKEDKTSKAGKLSQGILNSWKRWVLTLNPRSVVKYNVRNFSGDLDPILTSNPSTLKKVPQAATELYNAMMHGEFTPELKKYADLGGFQQLLYAQEISQASKLKPFERFRTKTVGEQITRIPKAYAKATQGVTNYRESVSRYATYLDYLRQIKESPKGLPKNYGASKPEVIQGLKTAEDKAFKLSNDLMGAYDEISEMGQTLRKHWIPFYSWLEVNFKRHKQFFSNALYEAKTAETVGNKFVKMFKIPAKYAYKAGKLAIKIATLTSALAVWNNTVFPELEEEIPPDVRARPHIILGKDPETGEVYYFSRLGAVNDFLEWFGLGTITQDVRDIMNGERTLQEQLMAMAKQPVTKVVSGITPAIKTPTELLYGETTFPDITKPRPIKDKGQHLAQTFGISQEYNKVFGKPSKPYSLDTLKEVFVYKTDPEKVAYDNIRNQIRKYKEKIGKATEGYSESKKSDALYNYKLSLKLKDKKSADKYLQQYFELGGNAKGFQKSIDSMAPLSGLSQKDVGGFVSQLTTQERKMLDQAHKYYNKVLQNK